MLEDIQYALRQARKAPGFAFAAITTLALGIGAAAAMFVLIQGVLLSPPPYANPDRLVFLTQARVDGQPYLQGHDHRPMDRLASRQPRRSSRLRSTAGRSTSWSCPTAANRSAAWSSRADFFKRLGRPADARPRVSPDEEPPGRRHATQPPARRAANGRHHRPRTCGSVSSTATRTSSARRCKSAACRHRCRSSV